MTGKRIIIPILLMALTALAFCTESASKSDPVKSNALITLHVSEPNEPGMSPSDPNNPFIGTIADPLDLPDEGLSNSPIPKYFDLCDQIFSKYVSDKGHVRYSQLRRKRADLIQIGRLLEKIHPAYIMGMSQKEKVAFWINTYNICTLRLIVDNYPIEPKWYMITKPDKSIWQISNAWTKHYFPIMGLEYNLREIEQDLLFKRFPDPRICFALSYASIGGGRISNKAYRAIRLDKQLDEQVRKYLATPRGYRLDEDSSIMHLSNLFSSNRKVFLSSTYSKIKKFRTYSDLQRTWLNFLIQYLPEKDVTFLENNTCTFKMIAYDWHLDDAN